MRLLNRLSEEKSSDDTADDSMAIRIRPELNLDYPHADVESINELPDKGFEIITTFFGLYGVASPLPGYYTEELLDEEWEERHSSREFLDVIHQHLYPMLYDAWMKYRFSHNAIEANDDRYWEIIYSILGLPEEFREFGDLSGQFIKYAGIISQRPKTQLGLKVILSDYLSDMDVEIEPCAIRNVEIVAHQRCKLSENNNQLGVSGVIGEQISDRSGKYIMRIGPINGEQFQDLLNSKKHMRFIKAVSKLFLVQPLECDIILELEEQAIEPVSLGDKRYGTLGQSTWLVDRTNQQKAEVVLRSMT